MVGEAGAKIRFMFTSDVSNFDLSKIDKTISKTKIKTEALNAAFKTLQLGMAVTIASSLAIVTPFSIASRSVGELDKQLRLASTAAGDTRMYTDMMDTISDLAVRYGIAKAEIASGVYEMARAGMSFAEVNEVLTPALQLAMGNAMDLGDALGVAVSMFNLFSYTGHDATTMLEMLDKATDSSMLSVQQLPSIIEQTGSAYAVAGIELEKYLGLMASLAQSGVTMGARHGSIITQMLGREGEIEDVLGVDFIKDGIIDLDLMMQAISNVEKGSEQYQRLLSVFGAGKGGKTFTDLMMAADAYEQYVIMITDAGGYMEGKAANMAESLPAMMARVREAMSAPFANPEVIERMNLALNSLLSSFASEEYERVLADLVIYASNFISDMGPQMVSMLIALLEVMRGGYPLFMNFASMAIRLLNVLSHFPPELLLIVGGMFMMSKNIGPLIGLLVAWAGKNVMLAATLKAVYMGMMGAVAGFMLAVTAGDSWIRWVGVAIATLSALAAAIWAVNAAKAAGLALTGWGLVALGGAVAAVGAITYLASEYSAPAMGSWDVGQYGGTQTGTQQISAGEAKMYVNNYVETQNNYSTGGEEIQSAITAQGGI